MTLGNRIKYIRTDILKESQNDFCDNLNSYIKSNYSKEMINIDSLLFMQSMISQIENDKNLRMIRLVIILNYFHQRSRINPNWLILDNNNSSPLFITKIEIDSSLVEIYENIKNHSKEILNRISDLSIIIENSSIES